MLRKGRIASVQIKRARIRANMRPVWAIGWFESRTRARAQRKCVKVVIKSWVRADFEASEYPQNRQEKEARFGGIENLFGEAQREIVRYSQVRKNAGVIITILCTYVLVIH